MFYDRLRLILERNKTARNVEKVLDDPKHPQFAKILEFATDRVHGKVQQSVDVTSEGKALPGVVILPQPEEPKPDA